MPKNKGKFKSQRAKSGPDVPTLEQVQSLTSRVVQQIRPHAYKLAAVLGGLVVVLVAFSIYSWYSERRDTRATTAFGKAMRTLDGEVVSEEPPATDPAATPPKPPETIDPNAPPRFKSDKEKTEAALADFQKLNKDYGASGVARDATLIEAALLYDLGRYDDAAAAYRRFLGGQARGEMRFIAREGLGYSLEAKGLVASTSDPAAAKALYSEALREFEALEPDEKGPHRDLALYHQGRIKALLGDRQGAIELYQKVQEIIPPSPLVNEVSGRIGALEEQEGS